MIQEQLRQVGILVEIQSLEWGTFFSDVKKGNFQLYGLTWVGISDPDIFYHAFHSASAPPDGANRGGYSDARVDRLTEAARREPSREKRREMYREVQRILARDLPVFPLWAGRNLLVRDRRLEGFALTPDESYPPVRGMRIADRAAAEVPVSGYFFGRLLLLPVAFGVVTVVFFLLHLLPGDPVEIMLGESAVPALKEELRRELHLDRPLLVQYAEFLSGLPRGDLGTSFRSREPVSREIARRFPATLLLASTSIAVAVLVALPLGMLAATRRGKAADYLSGFAAMLSLSIPNFLLGPLLVLVFSVQLGLLPVSGRYGAAPPGAARRHAGDRDGRADDADGPGHPARGAAEGVRHGRHGAGAVAPGRGRAARAAQRPRARRHGAGAVVRRGAGGKRHRGDDLLVAGDRAAADPGDRRARLSAGAGVRPRHRPVHGPGEPGDGPAVRAPRPEDPV